MKSLLLISATRTPAFFFFFIKIKSSETEHSIGFDCPYAPREKFEILVCEYSSDVFGNTKSLGIFIIIFF